MIGDIRRYLPGWMLRADTDHWKRLMRATLRVVDSTFDNIRVARLASMPGQVKGGTSFENVDALPLIARDRAMIPGKQEPPEVLAARLRDWHSAKRLAGTSHGLLYALRAVLSPAPATLRLVSGGQVVEEGYWWTLDNTGVRFQSTDRYFNHNGIFWPADGGPAEVDSSEALPWNWDSAYWPGSVNPNKTRLWVIVYAPAGGPELAGDDGTFDDGLSLFGENAADGDRLTIGTTATLGYVEAVRATCEDFKPAGITVSHIIITRDPLAFNPTNPSGGGQPDGWWKHHGKIVDDGAGGYERVRARSEKGRYWIGTV